MRVHHLNCGTLRRTEPAEPPAVCHCLLIETDTAGLVLVDTGIGTLNLRRPIESLGEDFLGWAEPALAENEPAIRRVERLGFTASDVRHVIVTHLHRDHVGGLPDFPEASVHLHQAEYDAGVPGQGTYFAAAWAHGPAWVRYNGAGGDDWHGFEGVRQFDGLPAEILMVPLTGHTPGHIGVAVETCDGWLLHAGDAYVHRNEIRGGRWPESVDLIEARAEADRTQRLSTLDLLRTTKLRTISAHDPVEFAELAKV